MVTPNVDKWRLPKQREFKFNVDGAVSLLSGSVGIGIVVGDAKGELVTVLIV